MHGLHCPKCLEPMTWHSVQHVRAQYDVGRTLVVSQCNSCDRLVALPTLGGFKQSFARNKAQATATHHLSRRLKRRVPFIFSVPRLYCESKKVAKQRTLISPSTLRWLAPDFPHAPEPMLCGPHYSLLSSLHPSFSASPQLLWIQSKAETPTARYPTNKKSRVV